MYCASYVYTRGSRGVPVAGLVRGAGPAVFGDGALRGWGALQPRDWKSWSGRWDPFLGARRCPHHETGGCLLFFGGEILSTFYFSRFCPFPFLRVFDRSFVSTHHFLAVLLLYILLWVIMHKGTIYYLLFSLARSLFPTLPHSSHLLRSSHQWRCFTTSTKWCIGTSR